MEAELWLDEMDELRHSEPRKVLDQLKLKVKSIPQELGPRWHGIAGTCCRQLLRHDEAEYLLERGLRLPRVRHEDAGDLHQRLSNLWLNRGVYQKAYRHNCSAICRHFEGRNELGISRSFVDRGAILGSMGHYSWSTQSFERALHKLPLSEARNRAAAFHGIMVNYLEIGEVGEAMKYLGPAEEATRGERYLAKLWWSTGRALERTGFLEEAEQQLVKAVGSLSLLSPVEGALATIDLTKVLVGMGKLVEAHRVAAKMRKLVGYLSHLKVARAAAEQLGAIGLRGEGLSLALLTEIRREVLACATSEGGIQA